MTKTTKGLFFAFLLNALFSPEVRAATINAASCNRSDVQTAINFAANGDTVVIPAGTCTWTTGVSISKNITVRGAGVDVTTIIDNVPAQAPVVGAFNITISGAFRITGFTAQQVSTATTNAFLIVSGGSRQFRMDHIKFTNWNGTITGSEGIVQIFDTFGVADHLTVITPALDLFEWRDSLSYLGVGDNGDNSWAQPDAWGTANAFYVEDSTFDDSNATFMAGVGDCPQGGCRVVVRYNTLRNTNLSWHGTESSQRGRGGRHGEVYNNTFTADGIQYPTVLLERSGTSLVYKNTMRVLNGGGYNSAVNMVLNRIGDSFNPWGVCDGSGRYDQNDGGATPTIYARGTAAAGSTTDNLIVAGPNPVWATNQWAPVGAPYSIRNTTLGWGAEISSNGSNTISSIACVFCSPAHNWFGGNTFEIRRATACIDQPGRGAGTYISGATPTPTGWVNEVLSPTYEWLNTFDTPPSFGMIGGGSLRILANRDYYNYTASFTGSSGVGARLLLARPPICTPRVGYWATDNNASYVCTATNTWTSYYTPFPHPHPLTLTRGGSLPLRKQLR